MPTPYAVAPDTGQSVAPVEHEEPVEDENADASPWGFEPVEATQRSVAERRSTLAGAGAPAKNMFARSEPVKKKPAGALASLFAKQQQQAKTSPVEMKQAVKTYAAAANGPSARGGREGRVRGTRGGARVPPVAAPARGAHAERGTRVAGSTGADAG